MTTGTSKQFDALDSTDGVCLDFFYGIDLAWKFDRLLEAYFTS